jgi:ubiquinone/menaquinone biosynthesis C-methylase UbiE
MDKSYAQKILEETKQNYNLISGHFSSTRQFIPEDLVPLLDYITSGDKVLDVGCGNGRLYPAFKKKNINYTGIDNSEELISIGKKQFPEAEFSVADILKIPFPDNSFDKVYCIAVLHHIPSKQLRIEALRELKRVLKPNGTLVLTVWNLWPKKTSWSHVFKTFFLKIIGRTQLDPKDILVPWKNQNRQVVAQRYIRAFTKRELRILAIKIGLKIKKIGLTYRSDLKDNNIYLIASK